MKITISRDDLLPEHVGLSCSKVKFEHLGKHAQLAVELTGLATFRDGSSYNRVYAPSISDFRESIRKMTKKEEV